jgi:hypothetical protein
MLEFLLIVILLVVFAPLWLVLIYIAGILILYVIVFLAAGALTTSLILWAGGAGALAAMCGLIAAFLAVVLLARARAENSGF